VCGTLTSDSPRTVRDADDRQFFMQAKFSSFERFHQFQIEVENIGSFADEILEFLLMSFG
jgi:hypothetical protein